MFTKVHSVYQQEKRRHKYICLLLLPIMSFGIFAYGFVGQLFSKQLYTHLLILVFEAI